MVSKAGEDDLFALAAQAGRSEAEAQTGLSVGTIFLEPEPDRRQINQKGDDPGFETRVRPPKASSRTRAQKPDSAEQAPAKKPVGRPRGTSSERTTQEVSDALQQKADELFAVISLGLPVTGTYGVENSDKAVKALMAIAKRRPKLLKALMRVADGADGMDLGRYVLGIGVALQVDMGRIQPDMLIARATGVTEIVEKYFVRDHAVQNPNVTEQVTHVGPRFSPVS